MSLPKEYYETVARTIEESGQFVQCVFDPDDRPGPTGATRNFAYTIGNHRDGLPELLTIAPNKTFWAMLNVLGAIMRAQERRFEHGERVLLSPASKFPVMVIDVDLDLVRRDYTVQAGQLWQTEDYDVQQVIYPDKNGKFPHEPGYDWWEQTLLNISPIPMLQ